MAAPPDPDDLAKRILSVWQHQITALADSPDAAAFTANAAKAAESSFQAYLAMVGRMMPQSQATPSMDEQETDASGGAPGTDGATNNGGPDKDARSRSATADAAPGDAQSDLDGIARRLDALEQRLSRMEQRLSAADTATGGDAAKPKRSGRKSAAAAAAGKSTRRSRTT
ncbi:MAG: hypothetical protein ACPGNT_00825 [Rhodospirillales bacterium]